MHEYAYAVSLQGRSVGRIIQRGDYTRFALSDEYIDDPARPVLGLLFEEDLRRTYSSALRLPPWFSNLLPEGPLRQWIADDRGVSSDREMELLAQVGHDLPGGVCVTLSDEQAHSDYTEEPVSVVSPPTSTAHWRFSLAGVALKLSMLARDDRLTLPAYGAGGDWIVKLPDSVFQHVPQNEFVMMSLARGAGIDIPDVRLIHRDDLPDIPGNLWTTRQEWAYAISRFDRDERRTRVHIEDLAQVRNLYPEGKYLGNYESVANLIYRGYNIAGLREFARRLAFCILIANGDAHLKNWSLIYRDPRVPDLAPAYDLVATAPYRPGSEGGSETLALKLLGSRRPEIVSLDTFHRLQGRLHAAQAELPDVVATVVKRVREEWPRWADELAIWDPRLAQVIGASIDTHSRTLLRTFRR